MSGGKLASSCLPTVVRLATSDERRDKQRSMAPVTQEEHLLTASDEPRRSGRATKGQHKHASSSPAPAPKTPKVTRTKRSKKSTEPTPADDDDDDDEEIIRCVCGDSDPDDPRTFISCDACSVWQHSVCMGLPVDSEDMPDHYFCEECRPEEHQELLQALERGEKIWEARNKIFQSETKANKGRKGKGKNADGKEPGWLRKDVEPQEEASEPAPKVEEKAESSPPAGSIANGGQDAGHKRKRGEPVEENATPSQQSNEKSQRASRQDKRRKSSTVETKSTVDTSTALVDIQSLPPDRQKIARVLSKIIAEDIEERNKSGFSLPDDETPNSLADHYAARIEYALYMNHGGSKEAAYVQQFRALNANLKKNNVLIERLLDESLTADDLSTMSTSDMASDELQRERAVMKEALDRQAVAINEEGPRYRQDHKGYQLIEDENQHFQNENAPQPPRTQEQTPVQDHKSVLPAQDGSPMRIDTQPLAADAANHGGHTSDRRTSSQNFDMGNIWAKTAHSPTQGGPRQIQIPRRDSGPAAQRTRSNGAQDDPDIDRLLDDNENDEPYSPAEASGQDTIVWRGKLAQSNDEAPPTVNARFVAGRDLSTTIRWQDLFPATLSIDGRLQTTLAEEYLCGLRWSSSSDVSVLAMTPYDNADAFNAFFDYFYTRKRYAVVAEGKPTLVKELYIIPIEAGTDLPDHVDMLEHCSIKKPIEERLLLMTLVVARSPDSPPGQEAGSIQQQTSNGGIPQHVRHSTGGPAGSPLNTQNPVFSPPPSTSANPLYAGSGNTPTQNPLFSPGHNAPPPSDYGSSNTFPPNPYGPQQGYLSAQGIPPHPDPQVNNILGDLQYAPTAQEILRAGKQLNARELDNLRRVLTDHPSSRTDMATFAKLLGT